MRRAALMLWAFLPAACHYCVDCREASLASSVTRFGGVEHPPVDSGRYPGRLRFLTLDDPLAVRAAPLRADAESHEQILRRLVRARISVKSPLEFQFMYAGHDSAGNRLVLRYFSRAADPNEVAGWQVQLVYALPSLRLERAYVQAVPLE